MQNRITTPIPVVVAIAASWTCLADRCCADRFQLKDGRVLTGKVVRTDTISEEQKEETRLAIEVASGVRVDVYESDLSRSGGHLKTDPREEEYRQKITRLSDTADAHYKAAQWCTQQGLRDLARAHYFRTIDLNPNHSEARAAVGYTKSSDTGRWVKRENQMHERGKILHKGKWIFPEYIPMDYSNQQQQQELAALKKNINRWHSEVLRDHAGKGSQALAQLEQLDDPLAIEPIGQLLLNRQRGGLAPASPTLKRTYVAFLARFDQPAAIVPLAHACVADNDPTIRNAALDAIGSRGRNVAIPVLTSYLRGRNNELINRAGFALGQLGASEAILPMIDALITRHEFENSTSDSYSPGGLAVGGSKKRIVDLENESVRSSLTQITGQGALGYDKTQWRNWYASVYAVPAGDLRREP